MISDGNNEEIFVEINRATKHIKPYCGMLHDLSDELCEIDIKCEENEKVFNLNNLFQELGKGSVVFSSLSCGPLELEPIWRNTTGNQLRAWRS